MKSKKFDKIIFDFDGVILNSHVINQMHLEMYLKK